MHLRKRGRAIKLVVSDIDGTLLPPRGAVSPRNRRAVAALEDRGIPLALASGRWFPSTASVAREVGATGPLIAANGGCVITVDGEILKEFFMADADVQTAYDMLKDTGALITSYVRGAIYRLNASSMENRPPEADAYFGGDLYTVIDDDTERFEREACTGVYKMEAYSNDAALLSALGDRLMRAGLSVTSSLPTNIEITSGELGKGAALQWLAAHLDIDCSQVMAFGDNTNDLAMLARAGYGVAMGNSAPELKRVARIIAPDCVDDGFARVIEERVL
ncbi:MAG: Cof-type HAD-IIB family hydrolase [Christensenellales bacterium]